MVSKKLLSFFTAICLVFGSASVLPNAFAGSETSITASAATVSGDYEYSVNEGFVRIEKYNGKAAKLAIPSAIDGKPVRIIGESAFKDCKSLTEVAIPENVETISDQAFYSCSSLTDVTISRGVKTIGSQAFFGCRQLKSVLVPGSVTSVEMNTFGYYSDAEGHWLSVKDFLIYCESGTAGYYNAIRNNYDYRIVAPVKRIAGTNRYATAAAISEENYTSAETVVLAYGLGYADALAGVPLANKMKAPLLLTNKDTVPAETINEIKRLGAKRIIILGGTGVISDKAVNQLKSQLELTDNNFMRLADSSRYGTAVRIADYTNPDPSELFFVFANNSADALSVSSVAAGMKAPIIYLNTDGEIDAVTKAYLASVKGKVKNAYVIGGKGVISDNMMNKAAAALGLTFGKTVTRVAGSNRYSTCTEINIKFADCFTSSQLCIAKGLDFPDALAGGTFSAVQSMPMLLADNSLNADQQSYLKKREYSTVCVFGGTGAVPESLVNKVLIASA